MEILRIIGLQPSPEQPSKLLRTKPRAFVGPRFPAGNSTNGRGLKRARGRRRFDFYRFLDWNNSLAATPTRQDIERDSCQVRANQLQVQTECHAIGRGCTATSKARRGKRPDRRRIRSGIFPTRFCQTLMPAGVPGRARLILRARGQEKPQPA